MIRLTIYENNGKSIEEFPLDEYGEMRSRVQDALEDLKNRSITGFTVSRISKGTFKKPFWEKEK